jgi:hypothetical protein
MRRVEKVPGSYPSLSGSSATFSLPLYSFQETPYSVIELNNASYHSISCLQNSISDLLSELNIWVLYFARKLCWLSVMLSIKDKETRKSSLLWKILQLRRLLKSNLT